jgi:hypothetical protein
MNPPPIDRRAEGDDDQEDRGGEGKASAGIVAAVFGGGIGHGGRDDGEGKGREPVKPPEEGDQADQETDRREQAEATSESTHVAFSSQSRSICE